MTIRRLSLPLLLAALALPAGAQAQATRNWVSGVGDDANPCSRTAPCKTWAGTILKTIDGGMIDALDPGGFGSINISRGITLDGTGHLASTMTSGNGIIINGAGKDVILRHLSLSYVGPAACTAAGANSGIRVLNAHSVTIDDVSVRGFPGAGIDVEPTADGAHVVVRDSVVHDNCTAGVLARPSAGSVSVDVFNSSLSNNPVGVLAGSAATVRIAHNTVTHNGTGLLTESGGSLVSFGDNRVSGNGTDGTPTSFLHQPPGPPPGPGAASGGGGTPGGGGTSGGGGGGGTPTASTCLVPKLSGLTFRGAVDALFAADCRLGHVTYRYRRHHKRFRIYAQDIRAGVIAAPRTKIGISINAKRAKPRRRAHLAAAGTVTRAWVSVTGSDANATAVVPCGRTAPCATFATAVSQVLDGGEINVLEPGDYGPVTIDRPVTIDGANRQTTVIATGGGSGITVDAGAGDVTLRNLLIQNDAPCTASGAGSGIKLVSAHDLHVENVTVRGFPGAGLSLMPASPAKVAVDHSSLAGNCTAGVTATTVDATLTDGSITGNPVGIAVGSGGTVRSAGNRIEANGTAYSSGSGVLDSWGDSLFGNGAVGSTPGFLAFS